MVILWSASTGVESILLTAQSEVFSNCDITGAAEGIGGSSGICWSERTCALLSKLWLRQDIGSGVEIAQGVTTDETAVFGE